MFIKKSVYQSVKADMQQTVKYNGELIEKNNELYIVGLHQKTEIARLVLELQDQDNKIFRLNETVRRLQKLKK